MKFVRDLEACRPGQIRQLFVREDGQHIEVSTVPNLAAGLRAEDKEFLGLVGVLAGTAVSGEETMAFLADEGGEVTDWGGIATATGPGSRDRVLADLGGVAAA